MEPNAARRKLLLCLLFAAVAALFRFPWLGLPPEEVFDEVYHAKTALEYLNGQPLTEWVHPPTAKLLIAIGVWVFGYNAWAWRLVPALAGVALAPVFFLLARRVLASDRAAILATTLLLADGVYLVQSRIAMTNIFAVLFQLSAALFIVRAALCERLPAREMALGGLFLALALSTRWTSLWATSFLGLVLLAVRRERLLALRELLLVGLTFVLLPVSLYLLSYVPWMRIQGFHLFEYEGLKNALDRLIEHNQAIWNYHANLKAEHPYFSKWYTWPWLYRPTWYHFKQADGWIRGIVAIGNPALWWVSVPVSVWAVVASLRLRVPEPNPPVRVTIDVLKPVLLFSGLGYFCLYIPWGLSPRTLNYGHYLFEAIPYACLSLGWLLDSLWDGKHGGIARAYVALVLLLFLFFLPFLMGLPVPQDWFYFNIHNGVRPWTWFPKWV